MKTPIPFHGIALMLLASNAFAGGGDYAGNGAGAAESTLAFAHRNLGTYAKLCLDSAECGLNPSERDLLTMIYDSLPLEYENPYPLIFKSERLEPGFFIIDGQLKVARTGLSIGSPIFLNIDLLYQRTPTGEIVPITAESAVAILIHELGHHHGVRDHASLDQLGAKVAIPMGARTTRVDLGPRKRNIMATVIDLDLPSSFAQLLVTDGLRSWDLGPAAREALSCPFNGPYADPSLRGFSLFNLHWRNLSPTRVQLEGALLLYCGGAFEAVDNQALRIEFDLEPDDTQTLRIQRKSMTVRQADCGAHGEVCFSEQ